jgi:hypothetical protein
MVTLNTVSALRFVALPPLLPVVVLSATCGQGSLPAQDETLVLEPFFRELRVVRVESSAGRKGSCSIPAEARR